MDYPSELTVEAWINLMHAQQKANRRIERDFRAAGLPPYAWYDALWELERAGAEGLRQVQIERQMLVAQSNISRLIDRLEAADCISRRPCVGDGRGQQIVITKTGVEMRKRMWPVYAKVIQNVIGDQIGVEDAATLTDILRKLILTQRASI
jgi:DNA-binding MarR family transcriptional regulator